jgi:probable phosphoglycerate mutase
MRIAFLRHGPTEWNVQGRIQGHTDIALSNAGLARMAALRLPFAPVRIYASPMLRARQTAQALGLENPVLDARLMEQNWGAWEGLTRDEILSRHGVEAFLKDAAAEDSDAVAVAHLGVLRAVYTLATGWDMATPMPADLDVSKILLLSLDADGAAKIETLNLEFSARMA